MEWATGALTALWAALVELDRSALKLAFERHGLDWLWTQLRDYVFNWKLWLFAVGPALLLERWLPVFRVKRMLTPQHWMDAIYPLPNAALSALAITAIVVWIKEFYATYLPFVNTGVLDGQPLLLQGIGVLVITDFANYVSHRTAHTIPWLWHFHAIHHSQAQLNAFTTQRGHPAEQIYQIVIRALPIGFFGGSSFTWIGYLVLNQFWGYFTHSNSRINLGWLKYALVTPQYHRIHHSIDPRHYSRNYSDKLILWDWLFGSLHPRFDEYPETGVEGTEWILERSAAPRELASAWVRQMIYPLVMICGSVAVALGRARPLPPARRVARLGKRSLGPPPAARRI
jgi:sterol desaturase/sphingolipid hydroxylase (fatty acid hydroxylase superfamily)